MDSPQLRMTQAMQLVLRAMLVEPSKEAYGAEIGRAAGLPSGTITPILARLENAGILTHRIEDIDPVKAGRPRRKYYCFTPDGAERAHLTLARAHAVMPANRRLAGGIKPGLAGGTG